MRNLAESFSWPFKGAWVRRWLIGCVTVILLPIAFVPLLGYAVAATRAAERDPSFEPPAWHLSTRLVREGAWIAVAIVLLTAPFAVAYAGLASTVTNTYARVVVLGALALPWGLLLLLLMPPGVARFAASSSPRDLFDVKRSARQVRTSFVTWNVAAAVIVTAWAAGLACIGLLCVGLVPGVFYAILVSAHATASFATEGPAAPAR